MDNSQHINMIADAVTQINYKALQFEGRSLRRLMFEVEKMAVKTALENCDGNVSEAARDLGLERTTLAMKLKKLGLEDMRQRRPEAK